MTALPPLLLRGDCLVELGRIPSGSVDAIVTDPPYGLSELKPARISQAVTAWLSGDRDHVPDARGFMGRRWDAFVPPPAVWDECARILKPGGHLLAFAGSRTQDLMGLSIRLAGFEIRDSLAWLYGSGMPKSLDVSKAIDKGTGSNRERQLEFTAWMRSTGITAETIRTATGTHMASHYLTDGQQPSIATADLFDALRPYLPEVPERIERLVAERTGIEWTDYVKRGSTGVHTKVSGVSEWRARHEGGKVAPAAEKKDVPHNPAAAEWQGWGSALKPAHEPIIVARKPMPSTIAHNVLTYGTGAINIDAVRIHSGDSAGKVYTVKRTAPGASQNATGATKFTDGTMYEGETKDGRFPANVLLDPGTAHELDRQAPKTGAAAKASGITRSGATPTGVAFGARNGIDTEPRFYGDAGGASRFFFVAEEDAPRPEAWPVVDLGGSLLFEVPHPVTPLDDLAARFLYVPKASRAERPEVDGIRHPTVKPLAVMRWLVRLVTPPGGVVVDPFSGSGTTLEAAYLEDFDAIGCELTPEYWPLIDFRIARVTRP